MKVKVLQIGAMLLMTTSLLLAQTEQPAAVASEEPPLKTEGDVLRSNFLTIGLSAASSFDDNATSNNRDRRSDFTYDILPSFTLQQTLQKLNLTANYSPGFSIDEHYSQRRYFSQRGNIDATYRAAKHLKVVVHGDGAVTTNPFDQLGRNLDQTRLGIVERPNSFVVVPRTKQIGYETGLDVLDQLSEHTTLGVSGNFSSVRYQNSSTQLGTAKLISYEETHGRSFVSQQLSAAHTFGISYDFMDIDSPKNHSRLQSHNFQVFDEIKLRPGMKLSIFGGPEYSHLHNQVVLDLFFFTITLPITRDRWSEAGGAAFSWAGSRTAFSSDFVRKISDGGGLIGAVRLQAASAQLRRDLSRRWRFGLDGQYSVSKALGSSSIDDIRGYSAGVGFTRILTPDVSLNARYERLHQVRHVGPQKSAADDHNRVSLTLQYQWQHALGR